MSTNYDNVIVFGPTGAVGGNVALEASKRGAKVWLAMRDPAKHIDNIGEEQERQGLFTRVQADLSDPASVKKAVQKSGAKAAFLYLLFTKEGLNDAIVAMKDAGVEYVVFLSSFTIKPDMGVRNVPQSEIIAFAHAQAEIALEDNNLPFTALRPGYFASNPYNQNLDKSKTPYLATMTAASNQWDCITPIDIGRVGGAVLVSRPSTGAKEAIYLFGPQLLRQDEIWNIIKKNTGQAIEIEYQSPDDYIHTLISKHIPPPLAKYLVKEMGKSDEENVLPEPHFRNGVANIKKYSGYEPVSFEDYVKIQKL